VGLGVGGKTGDGAGLSRVGTGDGGAGVKVGDGGTRVRVAVAAWLLAGVELTGLQAIAANASSVKGITAFLMLDSLPEPGTHRWPTHTI